MRDDGVLILKDPTRGVDVGAKREIYGLCQKLAAEGMAILVASSEAEEVLGEGSPGGEVRRMESDVAESADLHEFLA